MPRPALRFGSLLDLVAEAELELGRTDAALSRFTGH
jgi:hypothetical protein